MPKKTTFWNKFDLQNAALKSLHRDKEIEIDAEGNVINPSGSSSKPAIPPRDDNGHTYNEDDGDTHMDASGAAKRNAKEAGLTSNIDNKRTDMDATNIPRLPPSTEARTASSALTSTGSSNGTGETQLSPYPRIQRNPFTETLTCALPVTFYLSMNVVDKTTPVFLKIGLNSPYDILTGNTLVAQTINTTKVKGLSNCASKEISTVNHATFTLNNQFPTTVVGATAATATVTSSGAITDSQVVPNYRSIYERIYESYHTIETKWRVTAEYGSNEGNAGATMFIEYDAFTGSSTGQVLPTTKSYQHYKKWNSIGSHRFGARYLANAATESFSNTWDGTWRPGQIARNTRNDEDIKGWYPTGAAPSPIWTEQLVMLAMGDDFSSSTAESCFNLRVDLEYLVQFKDLKAALRYPAVGDTGTNIITIPNDIFQRPFLVELVPP